MVEGAPEGWRCNAPRTQQAGTGAAAQDPTGAGREVDRQVTGITGTVRGNQGGRRVSAVDWHQARAMGRGPGGPKWPNCGSVLLGLAHGRREMARDDRALEAG